ncbi:hypothetical protein [Actinopolyspora mortivallis]|uniref:Uncharacterized protein n=1 Tax=Actinopolyspora mortivallis TaxID=33906 RepID=A0A2T0GYK2_ACTMO|nr:hypothetical protein [Actinopolyspora mortivallis]PRW64189.1 hypothetical protein CEP50_06000 [Actinopolyspora mortivallis]
MVNTAHFRLGDTAANPSVIVRDDRGAEVVELELPATIGEPVEADEELRAAGWNRSADWTTTDDGWVAPVVST